MNVAAHVGCQKNTSRECLVKHVHNVWRDRNNGIPRRILAPNRVPSVHDFWVCTKIYEAIEGVSEWRHDGYF